MKKLFSVLLITMLIIGNVSMVFADEDSLANYNQLDYIITGDNCYIDTGVSLFATSTWKAEISFNLSQNYNYNSFFGISSSNNPTYWECWSGGDGWFKTRFNNQTQNSSYYFATNTDYVLSVENTSTNLVLTLNGSSENKNRITSTNSSTVYMLHRQNGNYLRGKVYYIKMWSAGSLVREYVPVERKSDGVLGFFDKVNNVFYPNAGNGTYQSGNYLRYTITTAVNPVDSGTVSGAGSYLPNAYATLTATPAAGYQFSSWNDGNTDNPRNITVIGDATYTATFSPVTPTYTVSTSANPQGSGSVNGSGTYQQGSSVTITATPNTGYQFVNWSDGNTSNPRTITVNSNITLVANFELIPDPDKILIATSVNPAGAGYVTGGGYYDENEVAELEAVPNTGYQFVDWNDGNDDNPRYITVTDELNLIANFELINPPEPVDQDSMTLVMLLVSFLILVMLERGTVFNG